MKHARRLLVSLLVFATLLSNVVFSAAAAQSSADESLPEISTYGTSPIMMVDAAGNCYGRTDWPSLNAAKAYYGQYLDYHACAVSYGGSYFNYCYDFSNNTRMFFGVMVNKPFSESETVYGS